MDVKEHVAYAKSELQQFNYLTKKDPKLALKIEEIYTRLKNVKSPSAPKEEGGGGSNPYLRAELFDQLEEIKLEREGIKRRMDRVDRFMRSLEIEDRNSLYRVYVRQENKRVSLEHEAMKRNYSRTGLIKRLDKILEEF